MKFKTIAFCKIPIFRIEIDNKLKRYYLLGIPFLRIQIFNKSKKYSLFGFPVLKFFYSDNIATESFLQVGINYREIDRLKFILVKEDIVKESDFAFLKLKQNTQRQKSAVFGVLPPEKTGLAIFNKNAFAKCDYFDMFSDIRDLSVIRELSDNVFDLKTFIKMEADYFYKKFIYVLGNSSHNNPYLHMAKRSISKKKSWLYIHEANLTGLLFYHFEADFLKMKKYLIEYYPEFGSELISLKNFDEFLAWNEALKICGLRTIVGLTGIFNFIVNNKFCKNLVLMELQGYEVNIVEAFLPLPNIESVNGFSANIEKNKGEIYIGTFGVPSDLKFSLEIAQAVEYLREHKNVNIKLLVAGYGADNFFKKHSFSRDSIEVHENVSDRQFYGLISFVDLIIQLRKKPHGESSGPVVGALALDKKIITSKGFLDEIIEERVVIVDNDGLDYKKIAEKIFECILEPSGSVDYRKIKELYTYNNLAKMLDEL
ncbi:hypothetical protein IP360_07660 [Helicobacter winghamensis]|uniref:hypothetical protein n=1 Tax=Helicobacter winghamensis TaxID=157268 RepID=UPI0027A61287